MELYEAMKTRRSVRAYLDKPVEEAALLRILEAGRNAPSWCNRQCWRIVVVQDPGIREMLGEVLNNPSKDCFVNAPCALVVCADPSDSGIMGGKEYYLVDCAIAMEHMLLAATAEGLSTCWVGAFQEYPVRNILHLPKEIKVVGITPLGYAAEEPEATPRKPLQEIVYYDGWLKTKKNP